MGITRKDEVLVPNLTYPATINAISLLGAKPVLVDINKNDLLMDTKDLNRKITKKTKAIVTVHISGRGSNIKKLCKIAKKRKVQLVEDAAEAFMSKINGKSLVAYLIKNLL